VKGLELPEVDEDFLQKMGDFNSREEIEDYIRNSMQASAKAEYDENYYNGLIDRIREKSTIKYPPQVLSKEEENVLDDLEHELSHQQMNLDLYLKLRRLEKEEFIKNEVRPAAINRLERALIMQAIAKKYDIHVSKEALEKHIGNVITDLIRSGELEEVQRSLGERRFTEIVSMLATEQAINEAIRMQLRRLAAPESLPTEESEELPENTEGTTEEIQAEQEGEPVTEKEEGEA
jgi:trigger factor